MPELHVDAAAEEMLAGIVAARDSAVSAENALLVLARIGARAMATRMEIDQGTGAD